MSDNCYISQAPNDVLPQTDDNDEQNNVDQLSIKLNKILALINFVAQQSSDLTSPIFDNFLKGLSTYRMREA